MIDMKGNPGAAEVSGCFGTREDHEQEYGQKPLGEFVRGNLYGLVFARL